MKYPKFNSWTIFAEPLTALSKNSTHLELKTLKRNCLHQIGNAEKNYFNNNKLKIKN